MPHRVFNFPYVLKLRLNLKDYDLQHFFLEMRVLFQKLTAFVSFYYT
jgi:hypothetical protein